MLPAKLGWNKAFVNDEIIRGYMGELQDFMESVVYDRAPASGFSLAYETTKVIYAAYQSAEEGRRIDFLMHKRPKKEEMTECYQSRDRQTA